MIRINTPLHKLSKEQILTLFNETVYWCMNKWGTYNKRRSELKLLIGELSADRYGEFCPKTNTITIYYMLHKNVGGFVSTVIHEYTHYMQPCRTKYNVLMKKHKYYSRHPFERQAFNREKKFYKLCWKEIKGSF